MPLSPTSGGKKALLLGMVYSEEHEPKRGQEFRDRVRCESLEQHCGYDVFTLDDKHDDQSCCVAGRHCKANFADARRMNASIHNKFGYDISFDIIILDYFFSPVGWARERWTDNFFRDTIPLLAKTSILREECELWLPNLSCVKDSLKVFGKVLAEHYTWHLEPNPSKNPLYDATDFVTAELRRCPDLLTNETQIAPLNKYSDTPFFVLRAKKVSDKAKDVLCSTPPPTRAKRSVSIVSPNTVSHMDDIVGGEGQRSVKRKLVK